MLKSSSTPRCALRLVFSDNLFKEFDSSPVCLADIFLKDFYYFLLIIAVMETFRELTFIFSCLNVHSSYFYIYKYNGLTKVAV